MWGSTIGSGVLRMCCLATAAVLVGALGVVPATAAQARACPSGRVALTFDDGPSVESTYKIARVLRRERVRATFFMVGRAVELNPARARLLSRQGHKIYNHTYSHPRLTELSDQDIRRQVSRARRAFNAAGLRHGKLVRPPFGAIDARVRRVIRGMGYRTVLWTWDTLDWRSGRTANQIVRSVERGLRPGANIMLHDHERQATVRALPRVIRVIRARGYCLGVVNRFGRVVGRNQA